MPLPPGARPKRVDFRVSSSYEEAVARRRTEAEIRDLVDDLRSYIDRVPVGEEVIVTDHGRPIARLSPLDAADDRLAELVVTGIVRAPARHQRHLPEGRLRSAGPVSDLVADQRR